MLAKKSDRFGWLKDALADKGFQQSDLAKAWGCDSAVISRFIKSGEPKLTWDRAMSLARLLELSIEELQTRIAGNIPVKTGRKAVGATSTANGASKEGAVAELKEAVERARAAMPDATIDVRISYKRDEKL